jgi:EmrB/QacA subfamily drug resistance transporter
VRGSTRLTLVATILGSSIVFIDTTVVNVALPPIERDLGGGLATQQWVVDAYLLTLGSLILVGGSLGDIFGPGRMFAVGVAAFGAASILCGLAPTNETLIVFRGLQGVAGALLTPASLAVITAIFVGAERGAAIGSWTAYTGIAIVLGPLLGGWLIGVTSWRVIFFLNVPIAIVTLALALLAIRPVDTRRTGTRVDVVGAVLCVLGLGGIVFGFIEQPNRGWTDPAVAASLAGGVVCLVAFVLWERHEAQPMLPLRMFALRNFSVANAETLALYGGLAGFGFFLVLFLQEVAGYSPFQAGFAMLPVTIVTFALARYVGRLAATIGPRLFMAVGPLAAGAGVLLLTRLGERVDYWDDLLPTMILFGLGLALTVTPLTTTVLADAGPSDAGIASGVNNAVARVAGLVAIAVIGIAASTNGTLGVSGFHTAMAITGLLMVAGGVIGAAGIRNPS